jgi:hypothetical protein
MQYALLIYTRPGMLDGFSESERKAIYGEYVAVNELPGLVGAAQLQPLETATTVRVQDGQTLTSDGWHAHGAMPPSVDLPHQSHMDETPAVSKRTKLDYLTSVRRRI